MKSAFHLVGLFILIISMIKILPTLILWVIQMFLPYILMILIIYRFMNKPKNKR